MPPGSTSAPPVLAAPLRDPALDGLRGLAALLVFAYHYGGGAHSPHLPLRFAGRLAEASWVGLVLFFTLSGLLITGSLREKPDPFPTYLRRRAHRLLPLYGLALLLSLLVTLSTRPGPVDLRSFAIYLLFLQDLPSLAAFTDLHPAALPLYHLWSLAVEAQFYLVWPLLLLFATTLRGLFRLSVLVFLLSALFRFYQYRLSPGPALWPHAYDHSLPAHIGAMAAGAAVYCLLSQATRGPRLQWLLFSLLGLAGTAFLVLSRLHGSFLPSTSTQMTLGLPLVSLAAASLLALALTNRRLRAALSLPALVQLGRISYGFYVFHILLQPLFDWTARSSTGQASGTAYLAIRCCSAFFLTTAIAWLSFRFFERPLLFWGGLPFAASSQRVGYRASEKIPPPPQDRRQT